MKGPKEAGRFQTTINVWIISLKGTETQTETSIQEDRRETLGKWQHERGPREAGRSKVWRDGGRRTWRLELELLSHWYSWYKTVSPGPKADPRRDFWRFIHTEYTLSRLVPHMVSTMAMWDATTSFQLGSSDTSPCKGAKSLTKCPLPYKTLPLFLSFNLAETVQIRAISLGMQEELLAQQTKHQ